MIFSCSFLLCTIQSAPNKLLLVGSARSCTSTNEFELWTLVIGISSTAALFSLRAIAVCLNERIPRAVLSFSCLGVVVACGFSPFALKAASVTVEETKTCVVGEMSASCLSCTLAATLNSALTFLLIMWRLSGVSYSDGGIKSWLLYLCGREPLPMLSKTVLQGGGQYFL